MMRSHQLVSFAFILMAGLTACKTRNNAHLKDVPPELQARFGRCIEQLTDRAVAGELHSRYLGMAQADYQKLDHTYLSKQNDLGVISIQGKSHNTLASPLGTSWELRLLGENLEYGSRRRETSILLLVMSSFTHSKTNFSFREESYTVDYYSSSRSCTLKAYSQVSIAVDKTQSPMTAKYLSRDVINQTDDSREREISEAELDSFYLAEDIVFGRERHSWSMLLPRAFGYAVQLDVVGDSAKISFEGLGDSSFKLEVNRGPTGKVADFRYTYEKVNYIFHTLEELRQLRFRFEGISPGSYEKRLFHHLSAEDFFRSDFYLSFTVDLEGEVFANFASYMSIAPGSGGYTLSPRKQEPTLTMPTEREVGDSKQYLRETPNLDSSHTKIREIVKELTPRMKEAASLKDKILILLDYTNNALRYDTQAFASGTVDGAKASHSLIRGKGVCQHYAAVFTTLARAFGLPARVIYGMGVAKRPDHSLRAFKHAWVEVLSRGQRWIPIEPQYRTLPRAFVQHTYFPIGPLFAYENSPSDYFSDRDAARLMTYLKIDTRVRSLGPLPKELQTSYRYKEDLAALDR